MPTREHYPKKTTEAPEWCNRCGRTTQHRVSGGRVTHCLEHLVQDMTKLQRERREKQKRTRRQLELFKEFE